MGTLESPARANIPVTEYVQGVFVPLSNLAHGWQMHSAVSLTPAEERSMVREPAEAAPAAIARRLPKLRVLVVPYVACVEAGDQVAFTKPAGETHSVVWVETDEIVHLILPCRELDAHDTGFEFLAAIGELLRSRLSRQELDRFTRLLEEELRLGVRGEIDEEALAAKKPLLEGHTLRRRGHHPFGRYRDVSFVSTVAEYMHGLWHDVQIRLGPDNLPLPQLRLRMNLLAEMFPPNPGFKLFAEDLRREE